MQSVNDGGDADTSAIRLIQANEYAASILFANNTIASYYLEMSGKTTAAATKSNQVQLDFDIGDGITITDFFFDQVLLVLQLQNAVTNSQTLAFFNFSDDTYVHLSAIKAGKFKSSILEVDDRRSNNQRYKVA